MSEYKLDDLQDAIEAINKYKRSEFDFAGLSNPTSFMGIDIFKSEAMPPKKQVIKLSEDIICSDEARAKFDKWSADLFGYRESIAFITNFGVIMSPEDSFALIANCSA